MHRFRIAFLLVVVFQSLATTPHAAAQDTHALIVVTSRASITGADASAGYVLTEVVQPYYIFIQAGWNVDIASPRGGEAPVNPSSIDTADSGIKYYLSDDTILQTRLRHTIPSREIDLEKYDVIFFAGGHGALWDFLEDPSLGLVAARVFGKRGILATVGEGAAVLLNTILSDGSTVYAKARLTSCTDEELEAQGVQDAVPYRLESALRRGGAIHFRDHPFAANTVVEDRLITGQNAASARGVAKAAVAKRKELLSEK